MTDWTDSQAAASLDAWLARDPDPVTRAELEALRDTGRHAELAARFAGRLQFGTAGIRGIVGAGPMRMNRLVVRETSAGLAAYVLQQEPDAAERGIVVSFDARPDSEVFARDATCVFLGAGLRVLITRDCQPTPVGAFAVSELGAAAGVVVTASHNPPEYNGYKVYWSNGAQIIPPHDRGIADCIVAAAGEPIPWQELDTAGDRLTWLGDEFVDRYATRVQEVCEQHRGNPVAPVSVAYTALHGVGAKLARRLALGSGLCEFTSVTGQNDPDGRFPTVVFPNPEEAGAMDAVIELAEEREATLALANDPDGDRLAVAVRDAGNRYTMLTGDQVGVLLGHYLLRKRRAIRPIVCASLVSSRMLAAIAESFGARYFETPTGFKWLTNIGLEHESADSPFIFAYEEALGYAMPQAVHDKDGLSALLAFVQLTAELAALDQTVIQQLEALYRQYGYYLTHQQSIATANGSPSITDLLRSGRPGEIAGIAIDSISDLADGKRRFADGRTTSIDTHPADVLIFHLADDSRIIVRPSGTEPKTKCYYEVIEPVSEATDLVAARSAASGRLETLIDAHQKNLEEMLAN